LLSRLPPLLLGIVLSVAATVRADVWDDPAFKDLSKGIELYNAEELDAAESAVRASLGKFGDNILAHYLLGEILLEKQQWKDAAEHFRRTIRLYPTFAEGHRKLGFSLISMDEFRAAETSFQKALSLAPQDVEALKGLAHCCGKLGKRVQAIKHYNDVLAKLGGADVDTLVALVNLYEEEGEITKAIRHLTLLLSVEKTPQRVKRLAVLLFNEERYEDAAPLLDTLVKEGGADAEVYYCLGMTRYALNDKDGCTEALRKALEIKPDYAEALYNLAVVFIEKKLVPRAIQLLKRCITADPDFVPAYETLGQVYEHFQYNIEEARKWYNKAKEVKERVDKAPASQPPASQPADAEKPPASRPAQ